MREAFNVISMTSLKQCTTKGKIGLGIITYMGRFGSVGERERERLQLNRGEKERERVCENLSSM